MTTSHSLRHDWYGYGDQLEEALADPALNEFEIGTPSPAAKEAAARVAIALGYCRVFGIDTGEHDGVFPVPEAIAAAEILAEWAERLAALARTLPERWDSAVDCLEADSYCMDILQLRMDLWVGMIILGEAEVQADLDGDKDAGLLTQLLEHLTEKIDEADQAIRQSDTLMLVATVAKTPLVKNWSQLLVEPYKSVAPYWLDGTLDRVNEYSKHLFEQTVRSLMKLPPPQPRRAAAEKEKLVRRAADVICENPPLAVAAESSTLSRPPALLRWRSPDGAYYAELLYFFPPHAGQSLRLRVFRTEDNEPATELAGAQVECAGVVGHLTNQAEIFLSVDDLHAAAQNSNELPLKIDDVPWTEQEPDLGS